MEAHQPLIRLPRARSGARAPFVPAWVRERLTTTPGRLTLISLLVVVGAVCFGVITTAAERSRAQAAQAAQTQTAPLLAQAVILYTALSDANATVTTTLLNGGIEPTSKRARYELDLRAASSALSRLTREASDSSVARGALGVISQQLPFYTGSSNPLGRTIGRDSRSEPPTCVRHRDC